MGSRGVLRTLATVNYDHHEGGDPEEGSGLIADRSAKYTPLDSRRQTTF